MKKIVPNPPFNVVNLFFEDDGNDLARSLEQAQQLKLRRAREREQKTSKNLFPRMEIILGLKLDKEDLAMVNFLLDLDNAFEAGVVTMNIKDHSLLVKSDTHKVSDTEESKVFQKKNSIFMTREVVLLTKGYEISKSAEG